MSISFLVEGERTSCPPAGAARLDLTKRVALDVVRATRSGGQDVRAPFELKAGWTFRQAQTRLLFRSERSQHKTKQ